MNGDEHSNGKPVVKITIPESPELMIQLAERLVSTHALKGSASPVGEALAGQIKVKYSLARERHEEGLTHLKNASMALEDRDKHLGRRSSRNVTADVSLKFYLECAAEMISKEQDPELLREFGFGHRMNEEHNADLKKFDTRIE